VGNIHVNTDEMRQLAGSFGYWSNYLRDGMLPALSHLTGQLETDWQGVSRQRYEQLIQEWDRYAMGLINSAEDLSRHLMNTANQFDRADYSS
jgi:WXG100 family type VII secretion target